jgi:predicted hydrocarbon binding protein
LILLSSTERESIHKNENESENSTDKKKEKIEKNSAKDEARAAVIESRNSILDAIMAVFSYLPDSAGKIFSNFGENWVDYKANLEGNCVSSRHCILSGEKKIQLLNGATKLQKMLSYFDAVITESKIPESGPSSLNKEKEKEKEENNQNGLKSQNLRARVLSMAICCARVVPLAAVTVRTCLFFGAANQR